MLKDKIYIYLFQATQFLLNFILIFVLFLLDRKWPRSLRFSNYRHIRVGRIVRRRVSDDVEGIFPIVQRIEHVAFSTYAIIIAETMCERIPELAISKLLLALVVAASC